MPVMKHVAFIGGTVGKAIAIYLASPEWAALRESSKYTYRVAFDVMRDKIGATNLCEYDLDAVNAYSALLAVPQRVERVVRGNPKEVLQGGPSTAGNFLSLALKIYPTRRSMPTVATSRPSVHPCRGMMISKIPSWRRHRRIYSSDI
jgi:hypothetical protein